MERIDKDAFEVMLKYVEPKDGVRASLLSREWMDVWRSISELSINDDAFNEYFKFYDHVKTVLSYREKELEEYPLINATLCFNISRSEYRTNPIIANNVIDNLDCNEPVMSTFTGYAVQHGIRRLNLLYPRFIHRIAWESLLGCETLKFLQLTRVLVPRDFGLGNFLTKLHMCDCTFTLSEEDKFYYFRDFFDPFKNFPQLRELRLIRCVIPSTVRVFEISSPNLEAITLEEMIWGTTIDDNTLIGITCNNVSSFKVVGCKGLPRFDVELLPRLDSIFIDVHLPSQGNIHRLMELLRGFGNASTVTLTQQTLETLARFPDVLSGQSMLAGMRTLTVSARDDRPVSVTVPLDVMRFLLKGTGATALKFECK